MRKFAWITAMVMLLAACSSDSSDEGSSTTSPPSTTAPAGDEAIATTTAPATTSAPATTAALTPATPFDGTSILYADSAPLSVTVTGTNRPQISWEAVAGADRYSLVILTDGGESVWAWSGTDTSVVVGGAGEVDRPGLGARVPTPSWGLVIASDPDGAVLAVSQPTAVGPSS